MGVGDGEKKDLVNIRVYDERRKVTREFTSRRGLLMSRMGYFNKYLAHVSRNDDIDIEVPHHNASATRLQEISASLLSRSLSRSIATSEFLSG